MNKQFVTGHAFIDDECYNQAIGLLNNNIKAAAEYFISPLYVTKLLARETKQPESIQFVFKKLFFGIPFADCLLPGAKELVEECKKIRLQNTHFKRKFINF